MSTSLWLWRVSSSSGRLAVQAARFKCCDRGVRQSRSPGQVTSSSRTTQGSTGHVSSTGGGAGHVSSTRQHRASHQFRSTVEVASKSGDTGVSTRRWLWRVPSPVQVAHCKCSDRDDSQVKPTGHVTSSGHVAQGSRGHVSSTGEHRASHQFR